MNGPKAIIDLAALVANWRMLASRAGAAQTAAVVKADAYGLGAAQVAKALLNAGCKRFYVAWPHEGVALRHALGPAPEIAVFHGPVSDLRDFRDHKLEPVLNSIPQIAAWRDAGTDDLPASIHLDTGMNRLGVPRSEWAGAAALLPQPHRVLSHLACGDEPGHAMNAQQLMYFDEATHVWPAAKRGLSATGGIYLGRDYTLDEVRPGIGLYGGGPVPENGPAPLPVLRLVAHILQVRDVTPGESVGYSASSIAGHPRRIATLGLGYADGFMRAASGRGSGFVAGQRRPIAGRVSMDLITVDVTGLSVEPGDEVELLGPNMPLADPAEAMGTIDYEVLTRLGARLVRNYQGGA